MEHSWPDGDEPVPVSDNVPTLQNLAKRACIRNIRAIVDVGGASYEQVRSVLLKLPNPAQLHQIETNSPHLVGRTAEIWRSFIKRDIEAYSTKAPPEPSNPASWYKLYRKLRRKEEEEIAQSTEMLAAQFQNIQDTAAQHTSRIVSAASMPKLPRAAGMRVEKRPGASAPRLADTSKLRFGSGSRTKTITGQDVLNRARREAKEMSLFSPRASSLARPTHQLSATATAPRAAPRGMVSAHARAREAEVPIGRISVPRRKDAPRPASQAQPSRKPAEPASPSKKRRRDSIEDVLPPSSEDEDDEPTPKKTKTAPRLSPSPAGRAGPGKPPGTRPRAPPDPFVTKKKAKAR